MVAICAVVAGGVVHHGVHLRLLSMLGGGSTVGFVAQAVIGFNFSPDELRWQYVLSAVLLVLFAASALLLARRALGVDQDAAASWANHVARSAVAVAAVGALFAVVTLVASTRRFTRVIDRFIRPAVGRARTCRCSPCSTAIPCRPRSSTPSTSEAPFRTGRPSSS